ncbi:MAG: hypothetical protein H0U38_02680 [Chloroflexia bacterium]|nr:hypothetical protein [Chloroflexia bacterium]
MATHPHQYPTLSLIDRAAGMPPTCFADDPAAPRLELRARKLLADYWSGTAWLTGMVSEVALCIVREILACERIALSDTGIPAPVAGVLIPGPAPVTDGAEANLAIHVGVAP